MSKPSLALAVALLPFLCGAVSAQKPVKAKPGKPVKAKRVTDDATGFEAVKKRLIAHRDAELVRARQHREKRLAKIRARKPDDLVAQERRIDDWYLGLCRKARRNYQDKLARLELRYGIPQPADN